jgi:tripartite-type tricarboxylate transporter receptor subunit TctC
VFANGDACWALASNGPLKDLKEIIVGAPALGGALHLDALEIGKKYNKPVRFIFYKTNGEAVIAMMQGDVNLTLDRVSVYESYKIKFPQIEFVAMTCSQRHHAAPNLQTLKEQNIDVPPIFNVILSSKDMDPVRRKDIRKIFEDASNAIGQRELLKLGDHVPAMFQGIDSDAYYYSMVERHQRLRAKWKKEVDSAR